GVERRQAGRGVKPDRQRRGAFRWSATASTLGRRMRPNHKVLSCTLQSRARAIIFAITTKPVPRAAQRLPLQAPTPGLGGVPCKAINRNTSLWEKVPLTEFRSNPITYASTGDRYGTEPIP